MMIWALDYIFVTMAIIFTIHALIPSKIAAFTGEKKYVTFLHFTKWSFSNILCFKKQTDTHYKLFAH